MTEHQEGVGIAPRPKYSTVRAVVTRADGTVEDRGIVSFTHRNPIINMIGGPIARFNGWARERVARHRRRHLP